MSDSKDILAQYVADSLALFREANIVLPKKAKANIYHHAGVDLVYQIGALFVNVVDRDYCKSFVVMQKGQRYPVHYHRLKTESMYALYGELIITIDGIDHILNPGEIFHIDRGQDHAFFTKTGTVFEEISTRYMPNDSVYMEEAIRDAPYSYRKTVLNEEKWEAIIRV